MNLFNSIGSNNSYKWSKTESSCDNRSKNSQSDLSWLILDISDPSYATVVKEIDAHYHVVHRWNSRNFIQIFPTYRLVSELRGPSKAVVAEQTSHKNDENYDSFVPFKWKAPLSGAHKNDSETESKHSCATSSSKSDQRSVESHNELAGDTPPFVAVSWSIHAN